MDQRQMTELMTKLLNSLTPEQKEKAKACKSLDELTACLGEMGAALPDELLDAVAGGDKDFGDSLAELFSTSDNFNYEILKSPKYPCPKCGSWNVVNLDPGVFWTMRVICNDCNFKGTRNGVSLLEADHL